MRAGARARRPRQRLSSSGERDPTSTDPRANASARILGRCAGSRAAAAARCASRFVVTTRAPARISGWLPTTKASNGHTTVRRGAVERRGDATRCVSGSPRTATATAAVSPRVGWRRGASGSPRAAARELESESDPKRNTAARAASTSGSTEGQAASRRPRVRWASCQHQGGRAARRVPRRRRVRRPTACCFLFFSFLFGGGRGEGGRAALACVNATRSTGRPVESKLPRFSPVIRYWAGATKVFVTPPLAEVERALRDGRG